jgi:hypothetical protein
MHLKLQIVECRLQIGDGPQGRGYNETVSVQNGDGETLFIR